MANRSPYDRIEVGLLTPSKKAGKSEIQSLLCRLEAFGEFNAQVLVSEKFEKTNVEKWPVLDVLIPYHLDKHFFKFLREYVSLRRPYVFNDIVMQENLLSRKFIYETMGKSGIPVLPFLCVDHQDPFLDLVENEDYIEVKGNKFMKPFVEKPITARNHDIIIYYSKAMGGGCRKLLRKKGGSSSRYYPGINNVRNDGVYIYEKFVKSSQEIKVYSVLSNYNYSERRKSPCVDGVVDLNIEGFEIRKTCPLTTQEIKIAEKVISVFKQKMCGFDFLRKNEKNSFVIDVNGMSFVKNNDSFYDDVAHELRNHFLRKMGEIRHPFYVMRNLSRKDLKLDKKVDKIKGDLLLGVVTIFRHGERIPKQKEKIKTDFHEILDLFKDTEEGQLVFKDPKGSKKLSPIFERMAKKNETEYENMSRKLQKMQKVMNKDFPCTKLQLKAQKNSNGIVKNVMIICKWGGILTESGKRQCQRYAKNFKTIYKGLGNNENDFAKNTQIYATYETRVQDSARIFSETLFNDKGPKIQTFSNSTFKAESLRKNVKRKINSVFNGLEEQNSFLEELKKSKPIMEKNKPWILQSFKRILQPQKCLLEVHSSIKRIVNALKEYRNENKNYSKNGEDITQILNRWEDVLFSFDKNGIFEAYKLCQIFDYITYDLKQNSQIFKRFRSLYENMRNINDFLSPAFYGITNKEKFGIAKVIVKGLLLDTIEKLKSIRSNKSEVKNIVYVGSKSTIQSLRNIFLGVKLASNVIVFENFDKAQFHYLSHITISLYEDTSRALDDPVRFYVNITFSQGVCRDPSRKTKNETFPVEILNPLLGKMGFEEFYKKIFDAME